MAYHTQINLVMLATVVGLVAFLYFRPQPQAIQGHEISSLSAEAAQSIRLMRQGAEMMLKKTDNRWYLVKPVQAKADEKKVEQILEILSAKSNHRFPLAGLSRFGLERPILQLYIDREFFSFGGLAPVTNEQYVATNKNVYLISPRYGAMLSSQPRDLVSPKLLAEKEIPVKFELDKFSVNRQDGEWNVLSQAPTRVLAQNAINRWVQMWQMAEASKLAIYQQDEGLAEGNEIKIRLQDGQAISLKILQNESELVLLRIDEGVSYHFPIDRGKQLLDPYFAESNHTFIK